MLDNDVFCFSTILKNENPVVSWKVRPQVVKAISIKVEETGSDSVNRTM